MAKSSLISTTNLQTPNKSIPYTLQCRIHAIIMDKNLRKTRLKELHTTLNQRGYTRTLINKGFELEKYHKEN